MRQDWIEFEVFNDKCGHTKSIFRPEYIVSAGYNSEGKAAILVEVGNESEFMELAEPYEQVKQKIMDAEKVDLSDAIVEHFTKEEYQRLLAIAKAEQDGCREDNLQGQVGFMQNIIDKLNKILKEEE